MKNPRNPYGGIPKDAIVYEFSKERYGYHVEAVNGSRWSFPVIQGDLIATLDSMTIGETRPYELAGAAVYIKRVDDAQSAQSL